MHLCIQCMITGSYSSRVPPFGYLRINSRSQIPVAFRSLLRPSSLPDAKASAVRPYYLDPYFFPSVVKEHSADQLASLTAYKLINHL